MRLGFLFEGTGWAETGIAFSERKEIFHVEEKKCPNQQSDERSPQTLYQVSEAGQNYPCSQNRGIAGEGVKVQERIDFFSQQRPGYDRIFQHLKSRLPSDIRSGMGTQPRARIDFISL